MERFEYEKNRGKWIDEHDRVLDSVPAGEDFVIIAGPWEGVTMIGAMQGRCGNCSCLVRLAPPSQKMIRERPGQKVLCTRCFELLSSIVEMFGPEVQ